MAIAVEPHVRQHPVDMLLLNSYAVALISGALANLSEEPCRRQQWPILRGRRPAGFAVFVITVHITTLR